jgi:hypothetical protein
VATNLANWLSGGSKRREVEETRDAWSQIEARWRATPLSNADRSDVITGFMRQAMRQAERIPAFPIMGELCVAMDRVLGQEPVGEIVPHWSEIESDVLAAASFRQMMTQRRRWVNEYDRMIGIVRERFLAGCDDLFRNMPEPCFTDWDEDQDAFGVPLIEMVEAPGEFITRLIVSVYDDDVLRFGMFTPLRLTFERNILVASGFAPTVNPQEVEARLVMPHLQKNKSPMELAEMYLAGTPYMGLMALPVPFRIPDEVRFEHCHIVGGTGHGKTQLMQRMIHGDLVAAAEDGRGVIVIDSQGDLINKLVRLDLFDEDSGRLADRLVVIDPADVEFPAALNLFDAHLDRLDDYSAVDRERVLNGVIELYNGFFGDLLGAELTQKQGVIFRYLARLMLSIPDATIHTLMQLMEDGRPFKPQMAKLDGSARYFFEKEFFDPSFSATKKQILKRLWGVLSTPAFERMFAQKRNKLDLFEAMQSGKIVLISTAKDLLKTEGSQLFGRFFVALIAQAALERSTVDPDERRPVHVYIDEAQEYFDDNIETILNQARKYRVGLTLAHQTLDQLTPRLRSALHANTSFKCVGGVSNRDARALADELRSSADFIESMKRRQNRTEFAAWLKNHTPQAIRLSVPLGFVEQQPLLDEEAYEHLIERNRTRYCGTLADVSRFEFPDGAASEPQRTEPPSSPSTPDVATHPEAGPARPSEPETYEPPTTRPQPKSRPEPREPGKGGSQHRYVQHLIKGLAEKRGFRVVIEEQVTGGQVDVGLHRGELSVACEISVTSTAAYEAQNLAKCLRAGFTRVWAIAPDQKRRRGITEEAKRRLSADEFAHLEFVTVEDIVPMLDELIVPETSENTVCGYRVKVNKTHVSSAEAKERRSTIARVLGQSIRRTDTE